MHRFRFLILCALTAPAVLRAGDFDDEKLSQWHQWRGPTATGVAPRGEPPLRWDGKTNLEWKLEIPGEGSSTPIVWGDQVFVLTAVRTERIDESVPPPEKQPRRPFGIKYPRNSHRFVVLSVDRGTGKLRWERTANEEVPHEGRHPHNDYASGSPTTDGKRLYASFGSRGIYCYDLDGGLRWERDLGDMQTRRSFGEGSSPVIHGDTLLVNFDHDGPSFIVALDARTGEIRWKKDRDEITTWSTPLVAEGAGRTQVVVNATRRVQSYDLASGEVIWECGGQTVNVIPSPLLRGDVVYCMSGYRGSALYAIPLDAKGDITGTDKVVWKREGDTPYVPSPLLYGDLLYFTKHNSGILTCLDAKTGELVFGPERIPGIRNLYASPVGAAGRVYFVARDGTAVVIEKGRRLEVLATNRLEEPVDASPAVAGKQLFLRGSKHLYCFESGGEGDRASP